VGEVDLRQSHLLALMYCHTSSSVNPRGEGAHALTGFTLPDRSATVRVVAFEVPLAKGVAERKDALFGARLVLVTPSAAKAASKLLSWMASSNVTVCSRLREPMAPGS